MNCVKDILAGGNGPGMWSTWIMVTIPVVVVVVMERETRNTRSILLRTIANAHSRAAMNSLYVMEFSTAAVVTRLRL